MKKFNLSEKIEKIWIHEHKKFQRTYKDLILAKDVKEAIRRLKDWLLDKVKKNPKGKLTIMELNDKIDKLAGEELSK